MFPFGIKMIERPCPSGPLGVAAALRAAGAIKHTTALTDAITQAEMAGVPASGSRPPGSLMPKANAGGDTRLSQADRPAKAARPEEVDDAMAASAARPPFNAPRPPARFAMRISKVATTEELGARTRKRRQTLGLTQQDVADAAGTGRRFVSELEAGKPTLEIGKILDVCQALGLDLTIAAR